MKRTGLSRFRLLSIRVLTLTLCYGLISPAFAKWSFRDLKDRRGREASSRALALPSPTPDARDGKRKPTGPYVPPALRSDNGERRAPGGEGSALTPTPTRRRAPLANLLDLSESRKNRKSKSTKRQKSTTAEAKTGLQKTESMMAPQDGLACSDCDPGGGGGAGGGQGFANDPYFGNARTEPVNETGEPGVTLGSRNFNWSMPLVSLPGRAGLDLSVALYYNSLVWTRQSNAMQYNADHGTPAPGFQIGLPRLQDPFLDTDDNVYAYMMITSSGGRVEMKQVGTTNVYESIDGSFTQLTFSGGTPIVRTTDGTQFIFGTDLTGEWRCTRIEDRNGNYISATYNTSNGHLLTLTDTLGRVIDFNYNTDGNLESISQTWGSSTHDYVTFAYDAVQMSFDFGSLGVYGATQNANQTVLSSITFHEETSYHFDYNSYGQVYRIRHKAPNDDELEHTTYTFDLTGAQSDCPRFTQRRQYAKDWNDDNEAVTTYEVTTGITWTNPETSATETGTLVKQTAPDTTTIIKQYSHESGWDRGLTGLTEFWSGTSKKKWVSTIWTQDNTNLSFAQNPRVEDTRIYDDASNVRRTTIAYAEGYNLPTTISEYTGSGGGTLRRYSVISYVNDSAYIAQRVIGLPLVRSVYDGSDNIVSKQDYQYDQDGDYFAADQPSTNFDDTYYSQYFRIGRGNLTTVRRFDCTSSSTAANSGLAIATQRVGYNLAGAVVWAADAENHTSSISYTDDFTDTNKNQGTMAYATTVTDPDGYSSSAKYEYDFGAVASTQVPSSGTGQNINYVNIVRSYDDHGRVDQITNTSNSYAYTRFDYDPDGKYVHTFQTIIGLTTANEFHSWQIFDGAGRVRATASDDPGSTGGYTGQYVIYNIMGQVVEQSNPTEISVSNTVWTAAGDDAYNSQTGEGGFKVTLQDYDWKGRPHQTTNPDGTTRVITYGGCGCAGSEVTLATDEHGRQRRYTKDALGRLATVEEMIWSTGNVYSTTTYSYNMRDQITDINQNGQQPHRTFDYDGHGRLKTRTTPEQGETNYSYNADDTTHVVTDARNVTTTYGYNNRHQVTSLTYNVTGDPTSQTAATSTANFGYDAAGNRTSMSDGQGSASYNFNNLGQMYSESRTFTGLSSYTLNYEYNLGGELKKITNSWSSAEVNYSFDKAGRLSSVGGAGYQSVTNYASSLSYRAFGAIKAMNYGDGHSLATSYDRNLRTTKWDVSDVLGYNYQYDGYYHERTGRVIYAGSIYDNKQDRSYEYDLVGRLAVSHSGAEARAHVLNGQWGTLDGPYSQGYDYDEWGNVTHRYGWGGEEQGGGAGQSSDITYSYSGNRRTNTNVAYDAAGNLKNDGLQTYAYDATGQQTSAAWSGGSYAPTFTDDPLNPNGTKTDIKLVHLTELRTEVNKLRARAGLAAVTNWNPDPNPQVNVTYVHHSHITQLRTKLEEAYNALHLSIGTYAHAGPNANATIYADDFQELRTKIKAAWTALTSSWATTQSYDGDGLRVKKNEYGTVTYYLRSTVLGGQVVGELNGSGGWHRGYVYSGSLLAVQQSGVFWVHEDPITKSKRVTDVNGYTVSAVELDPWGADTNASWNQAFQPRKYTSYERDLNGGDEAMFRRYNRKHARFDQPDLYEGSYSSLDPQSLNRYAYVQNDPVNFVDPSGLEMSMCGIDMNWEQCVGSGYFGGFAGGRADPNRRTSPTGSSGQQIIRNAEPLVRIVTFDMQENILDITWESSMFAGGQDPSWHPMDPIKRILEQKLKTKEERAAMNKKADDCIHQAFSQLEGKMNSIRMTYGQALKNFLHAYRPHREDFIGAGGGAILNRILKLTTTVESVGTGAAVSVGMRLLPVYGDLAKRIAKAYQYQDEYEASKADCNKLRP